MENNLPISANPDTMGGVAVFEGTRVPVKTLFEYLEHNYSLDDFLYEFPTVRKEAAISVLLFAERYVTNRQDA
jgi:uncharacterized protein (DUF433 family)